MSEHLPQEDHDLERMVRLNRLLETHFPDDIEFIMGMDEQDALGFVYGQLLELGEDPDEVLEQHGITEDHDEI